MLGDKLRQSWYITEAQVLQNDLNTLEQWSTEWQLSFNTTK